MIIVQPVPVTSAMVTASNVTITDTLWTAGTYTLNTLRSSVISPSTLLLSAVNCSCA